MNQFTKLNSIKAFKDAGARNLFGRSVECSTGRQISTVAPCFSRRPLFSDGLLDEMTQPKTPSPQTVRISQRNKFRAPIAWIRLSTALLAVVQTANAHPGHGLLEHGAAHVITSPYHLVILAAMGVAMIAAAQIVRRRSAQRFMRIAGIGAVIAAGALCALGY